MAGNSFLYVHLGKMPIWMCCKLTWQTFHRPGLLSQGNSRKHPGTKTAAFSSSILCVGGHPEWPRISDSITVVDVTTVDWWGPCTSPALSASLPGSLGEELVCVWKQWRWVRTLNVWSALVQMQGVGNSQTDLSVRGMSHFSWELKDRLDGAEDSFLWELAR